MPSVTLYANKSAYLSYEYPNANSYGAATIVAGKSSSDSALIGFEAPPENVKYKRLESIVVWIHATGKGTEGRLFVNCLAQEFDEKTVTYNTRPSKYQASYSSDAAAAGWVRNPIDYSISAACAAKYGVEVGYFESVDTELSSNKPYLVVNYIDEDTGVYFINLAPQSGYVPKNVASVFSWGLQRKSICIEDIKPTAITFRWRAGSSGTVHTIACGTANSVTVPAGTFTADEIQWSLSAALNSGVTSESEWYTLSTVEELSTAKPISPSGIMIDGSAVNRFSWQHIISTGTAQTKAELQWSQDGSNWQSLATVSGADTFCDVAANTFTSGTKFWRVRTYNTDSVAGEWSSAAEFIVVTAPTTPSVSVTSTSPRPSIAWQTNEQQAYQLELSNGYKTGTVYGITQSWRSAAYLPDGSYTVRVRVQNQYGMWSEWAEAALPVSNTVGEAITLYVAAEYEATLGWNTDGSYDFYLVDRDGVVIAKTTEKTYTDRVSIGSVVYQVRGCYADSYSYGLSDAVTAEILPPYNMLCATDSGEWLPLRLSETQTRANEKTHAAQITAVHLLGLAYPVAEVSEFRDLTLSVSCAFPRSERATAKALEALVGKAVCLKTPEGDMANGYLESLSASTDEFMLRYTFSVQHLHNREVIDIDA